MKPVTLLLPLLLITFISGTLFIISLINNFNNTELFFLNGEPVEFRFGKFVYLTGGVKNPGVYEFIEGEKIIDLIERSGGLTENADNTLIAQKLNLSEKLKDEQRIFVPIKQSNIESSSDTIEKSKLININSATIKELETLPGIGSVTAQRIIDLRPFENIEDIKKVSGISENKFIQIKDLITI